MTHRLVVPAICAASLLAFAPSPTRASDLLEATFLDLALNVPGDYNFEMNRQMHWRPGLNTDLHGFYNRADLFPEPSYLQELTFFAGFTGLWFDSDQNLAGIAYDLQGEQYDPFFGVSFQTFWDLDVGLLYSPGFLSFDAFEGTVDGDGQAHRGGLYLLKQFEAGYRFGASYLYQTGNYDATFLPFPSTGQMDFSGHALSVGAGYSRKYGENRPGKNIGVEMTVNALYATREFDQDIDLLGNVVKNSFDHDAWWFSWQNKLSHNLNDWLSIYATFTLYHLLDEDLTAAKPLLGTTLPYRDETVGEVGGGIAALFGAGFAANAGVRAAIFNSAYDAVIAGVDLSFKF